MNEKNIHLLLVEDDDVDSEAMERHIQKAGLPYDLKVASTEDEAIEALSSFVFDIVLLDYNLQTTTGLDLLPKVGDTPAIFLTGSGSEEIAIEAMRQGACDYLVKDPDRNYLKVLPFTVKNVLNRKETEMQFKNSEERFRALTENTNDLTVIFDTKRIIKYINPAIKNTFDYSTEEVTGKSILDFIHPDNVRTVNKMIDQAIANFGKAITLDDFCAQHKDGSWLYLTGDIIHMPDVSSINGIVGNFKDITLRNQIEKEREELIKDLQEALENIKTLSGLLPICSHCKKIRDDDGYWNSLESYFQKYSEVTFSHGMCLECTEELYGNEDWYIEMKNEEKKKE